MWGEGVKLFPLGTCMYRLKKKQAWKIHLSELSEKRKKEVHHSLTQNGICTQISLFRALYCLSYLGLVKFWCTLAFVEWSEEK